MEDKVNSPNRKTVMKVCALVPAYNEEDNVGKVVCGSKEQLETVLVVDDGSSDDTAGRAESAGAIVVRHTENKGKGAALITGHRWACDNGFDAVIVLDSDCQHDWNEIPGFIETAERENADMVVGNRMEHTGDMPWVRKVTNMFTSWVISSMIGQKVYDTQCGFRLMRLEAFSSMDLKTRRYDTESEMLILAGKLGHKIANTPIKTIYSGQTSFINPVVDTLRFFGVVFRYLFMKTRRKKGCCG
jgi:glycosyltransferase involved in cell wall biosynthesis